MYTPDSKSGTIVNRGAVRAWAREFLPLPDLLSLLVRAHRAPLWASEPSGLAGLRMCTSKPTAVTTWQQVAYVGL